MSWFSRAQKMPRVSSIQTRGILDSVFFSRSYWFAIRQHPCHTLNTGSHKHSEGKYRTKRASRFNLCTFLAHFPCQCSARLSYCPKLPACNISSIRNLPNFSLAGTIIYFGSMQSVSRSTNITADAILYKPKCLNRRTSCSCSSSVKPWCNTK